MPSPPARRDRRRPARTGRARAPPKGGGRAAARGAGQAAAQGQRPRRRPSPSRRPRRRPGTARSGRRPSLRRGPAGARPSRRLVRGPSRRRSRSPTHRIRHAHRTSSGAAAEERRARPYRSARTQQGIPMEWVETTGRTTDEAKDHALDQLGVDESDAEFEILEEPRPGLFGRIRGEARVRARVRPTAPRPKAERRDRRRKKDDAAAATPNGEAAPRRRDGTPAAGRSARARTESTNQSYEESTMNDSELGIDEVEAGATDFVRGTARRLRPGGIGGRQPAGRQRDRGGGRGRGARAARRAEGSDAAGDPGPDPLGRPAPRRARDHPGSAWTSVATASVG